MNNPNNSIYDISKVSLEDKETYDVAQSVFDNENIDQRIKELEEQIHKKVNAMSMTAGLSFICGSGSATVGKFKSDNLGVECSNRAYFENEVYMSLCKYWLPLTIATAIATLLFGRKTKSLYNEYTVLKDELNEIRKIQPYNK